MSDADAIRRRVAETYARAAALPAVSRTGAEGEATPAGVTARDAPYSPADLAGLPPGAWALSFGCGDPVGASPPAEGEFVLDLGCGAGLDLLLAARRIGPRGIAVGVELARPMAERVREHAAAAGFANVRAVVGAIERLPVRSGVADRIYANAAINLSPEKDLVFAEIVRTLHPGGRAILADVAVEEMPLWLREVGAFYSPSLAGAIGVDAYRKGLERAGLASVRIVERVPYSEDRIAEMIRGETVPGAEEARKALGGFVTDRLVGRAARDLAGAVARVLFEAVRPE
ncbi:MAG: methyltransferase domain-containing protein [Candidatus Eisenbacteria bacterium]|nr:methyltransferase domain-containing protein [Candidatus Eisenbacteria bacterium]